MGLSMEDSIQNNNETNAYANHAVWSQSNDYDLSYISQVRVWSRVLIVWGGDCFVGVRILSYKSYSS